MTDTIGRIIDARIEQMEQAIATAETNEQKEVAEAQLDNYIYRMQKAMGIIR